MLTAMAVGSSRVQLAWTDNNSDETGFQIERKTGAGSYATIATLGANLTSCVSSNLAGSTTYTFRVRAQRGVDYSAYSNEADATTAAPVAAPTALQATASGSTRINLMWSDNSADETGFRVERKSGGGSFAAIATLGANVTNCVSGGLTPSTTYTYRVRALRGVDASAPSNEADATTAALLMAPADLTATANGSRRIDLAWTDNAGDESGYKVERKSGMGSFQVVATLPAGATAYVNTGLTGGVAYTYRVRAYRGTDYSTYTGEAMATANP